MSTRPIQRPQVRTIKPIMLTAGFGKLYARGPQQRRLMGLPGATLNRKKAAVELSLTLQTFARIKHALGLDSHQLAACCDVPVLAWARAAKASEDRVNALHTRLNGGYRRTLPWTDTSGQHRNPFEHQTVMATIACELDGSAFLCEMGTGKTRAAIEAMSELHRIGSLDITVVLCPSRVMGTWQRECNEWSQRLMPVKLSGISIAQRIHNVRMVADQITQFNGKMPVLIINYDVIASQERKKKDSEETEIREGLALVLAEIAERYKVGLVLDEGHRVRNPNAAVTRAAMSIAQVMKWRLLMTGSPVVNGAQNVWSQWYCIDFGITFGCNWVQFRREFFDENEYSYEINPLDGTLDELNLRLRKRGVRYRKVDCLDLPPKLFEVEEIEMTREQQKAYDKMLTELLVELRHMEAGVRSKTGDTKEATVTAPIMLTMMLRLSQITSGFLPAKNEDDGTRDVYHFEPNPKLNALEENVREIVAQGQSTIVWCHYREDIERVLARLADLNPVAIYGGVSEKRGEEAMRKFQAGESPVMVANPQSAGLGITLTRASTAHYYSQGYSLEYRMQSEDRCHRAGSERHSAVTYIDYTCTGTIDEAIRAALAGKLEVAEAVTEFRRFLEAT